MKWFRDIRITKREVALKITEYTSDYSGKQRWAIAVNGRFPPELDFSTEGEAEMAMITIVAVIEELQ